MNLEMYITMLSLKNIAIKKYCVYNPRYMASG